MNIAEMIYSGYEERERNSIRRKHALGASQIGKPCSRSLWYGFRCCEDVEFAGRILRLFRRGERFEDEIIDELIGTGFEVNRFDADGNQFRATACSGHVSANVDGMIKIADTWGILEFKTHSQKSFDDLSKKGVAESKPEHYAQCMVGAGLMGVPFCLYIAENKNTSELYTESIGFDQEEYEGYIKKASDIVFANQVPDRISDRPDWYQCRFCDYRAICQYDDVPAVNCFTCCHSTPVDGGVWACALVDDVVPGDVSLVGCPEHILLPYLTPWQPVDGDNSYVMYDNGVCNCAASGFPAISDGDAPTCYSSEELRTISQFGKITSNMNQVKQLFGGKVINSNELGVND